MPGDTQETRVRIGELSRRVGVGVDTLRAWERRYGVLKPERTAGGFRLYGPEDIARAEEMRNLIATGIAASEAARAVTSRPPALAVGAGSAPPASRLCDAIARLDEERASAIIDRAILNLSTESLLRELVLPAMREIGERWQSGELGVGEEHFATNLVRGRLMALASGWGAGFGPLALLACPPGEQHDIGLVSFGLALRAQGWRIAYLGPDTPVATLLDVARRLDRPTVVVAATRVERFREAEAGLRELASLPRGLYIGGAGADAQVAEALGASLLADDAVEAAIALSDTR